MNELNDKERLIFDFVKNSIELNGYAPAVRDICHALEINSTSTVHGYLHRLEAKGYLSLSSGKSRAIRLTSDNTSAEYCKVPILSENKICSSIYASDSFDGYIECPNLIARGKSNLFAVRIKGNISHELSIIDGDIIIIENSNIINKNDAIAVLMNGEVLVKKASDTASLSSESVLGKVVANYRYY